MTQATALKWILLELQAMRQVHTIRERESEREESEREIGRYSSIILHIILFMTA
jgi:hypothetical protein